MMTVEVRINGDLVACAEVRNTSALAPVSDYAVGWSETAYADLGVPASEGRFYILKHRRAQSVWALVAKIVVQVLGQMTDEGRKA
jgi:hypothetical protein